MPRDPRGACRPTIPAPSQTLRAYLAELTQDGYAYRFRHDERPLGEAEGAFLLCGFVLALALQQQGQEARGRPLVRAQPGRVRLAGPVRRGVRRRRAPAQGEPAAGVRARDGPRVRRPAGVALARAVTSARTNEGGVKTMTQTVVITGASAGIGRATARLYGERGANVGLIARGQAGLDGAVRNVEDGGRQGAGDPGRRIRLRAGGGRRPAGGGVLRPDRRLDQRRVHLGVLAVRGDHSRRVPAGDRGQLPRLRARDHGGAGPDAAARARHDRAGGLRARRAEHPAAVRLLRRQARDQRVHVLAALRAAARALGRARHGRADAGGEHATVLLGAVPAAPPPAAGPPDLPAGGRRPRRAVRRRSPAQAAVLGRRDHRGHDHGQQVRARAAGPVPGPDRLRLPADRRAG